MLTNGNVNVRVLGGEFPDRTLRQSLRAGIDHQWVKGSAENLLFRNRVPICSWR